VVDRDIAMNEIGNRSRSRLKIKGNLNMGRTG
jgi:hypothetical protein